MLVFVAACSADETTTGDGSGSNNSACALVADTIATGRTSPSGCEILDRDTSACDDAREAAGIPMIYRQFSCRVTLALTSDGVTATSDGRPDVASNYYAASDPCHEDYTGAIQNPNQISVVNRTVTFPLAPNTTSRSMQMTAVIGLAINGVPLYANFAAPGDDIFLEARTFDRCGGHPQMLGHYHHHAEPLSISYDDARLIGFMRDGYPLYGRRDMDDSYPALDAYGGHTGPTPDSSTPIYHYHGHEQTSTASTSAGEKQWFVASGTFRGTPASCTGC
jgi:hypothetical protein